MCHMRVHAMRWAADELRGAAHRMHGEQYDEDEGSTRDIDSLRSASLQACETTAGRKT